jgi:hypothetical protein
MAPRWLQRPPFFAARAVDDAQDRAVAWWWRLAGAVKAVERAPQFSDRARARRERKDGPSAFGGPPVRRSGPR